MLIILLQSRVDVYSTHCPAGTSVQNMIHWTQVSFRISDDHDYLVNIRDVSILQTWNKMSRYVSSVAQLKFWNC